MSTATPRLQLTKPLGSESMILGASQISDAYAKIDAAIGVKKFATQGAATAVFNGDLILETTTNQSKLFNSPNWLNVFDDNNGRGKPQDILCDQDTVLSGFPERQLQTTIVNVEAARKYLLNFNFNLSAVNSSGGTLQGYIRLIFYYTTNIALAAPNVFIHDVASFISCTTSARSKNFKGMFEFFPNYTGPVKMSIAAQVITGNYDLSFNLSGSVPSFYMIDWGV